MNATVVAVVVAWLATVAVLPVVAIWPSREHRVKRYIDTEGERKSRWTVALLMTPAIFFVVYWLILGTAWDRAFDPTCELLTDVGAQLGRTVTTCPLPSSAVGLASTVLVVIGIVSMFVTLAVKRDDMPYLFRQTIPMFALGGAVALPGLLIVLALAR